MDGFVIVMKTKTGDVLEALMDKGCLKLTNASTGDTIMLEKEDTERLMLILKMGIR